MNSSLYYLKEGLTHISDIGAYDHILFVTALVALYSYKQWRVLFWLVTAFTVGHSIALALATFEIVKLNSALVEFLIPVTILLTCLQNVYKLLSKKKFHVEQSTKNILKGEEEKEKFHVEPNKSTYLIILAFGLIHGLGFSNYLRFMLSSDETLTMPLLLFNLGLEFGQILILSMVLLLNFVSLNGLKIRQNNWSFAISTLVFLVTNPILLDTGKSLFLE